MAKDIWEIYNETPIRQGKRFYHCDESLEMVYSEEATFLDSSFFVGAFLGERLIGFVKLTADETCTQANLMNIISMLEHRDKAPTNALLAQSVRSCAERGISRLVYQSFPYGKKTWDGLMQFKQVNGFQRVELPRYYVPLTPWGRIAFRLGMHHQLVHHLPESILDRLRTMRNAYYNRKSLVAKESA